MAQLVEQRTRNAQVTGSSPVVGSSVLQAIGAHSNGLLSHLGGFMYRKILVPYDESVASNHALREAYALIEGVSDAKITVLDVIEWHDFNAETFKIASRLSGVMGDALDMNAIAEVGEEAAKEATEHIAADIDPIVHGDERVRIAVVNGSPHDTITAYAEKGGYDCIIMGHRGLGAVRGMLGSVCYSVLHKATMPVLIVK